MKAAMRSITSNSWLLMKLLFATVKNFLIKAREGTEERPKQGSTVVIFLLVAIGSVILTFWLVSWLPYVNIESAGMVLGVLVPSTATILGLVIVATTFRWRDVKDDEKKLRENIISYLQIIGRSKVETMGLPKFVINIVYEKYLDIINKRRTEKGKSYKQLCANLGRLWIIRECSFIHSTGGAKNMGRYLTQGQTKELSENSKESRKAAIEMYENYRKNPAQFLVDIYETLMAIYLSLFKTESEGHKNATNGGMKNIDLLISIVSKILSDGSKLLAEETKRMRAISQPFYLIATILILAFIISLLVLTGINNTNPLLDVNQNVIKWLVGIPVGLSAYGVLLCVAYIRIVIN